MGQAIRRALRGLLAHLGGDYDLREVLVSIGVGIMAMQVAQWVIGPLPEAAVRGGALAIILLLLFVVVPRLPRRWRGRG